MYCVYKTQNVNTMFMILFFFFSGYFVPKSFDKRGAYTFLSDDRIKKLGIPLVLMSYLLTTYAQSGAYMFEGYNASTINSIVNLGAGWFLLHLILFNIAYSVVCGPKWSPKIECPSLLAFGVFGLFLAVKIGRAHV